MEWDDLHRERELVMNGVVLFLLKGFWPIAAFALGLLGFGGLFACVFYPLTKSAPNFPLGLMLGLSIGSLVLLFLYDGLIKRLER